MQTRLPLSLYNSSRFWVVCGNNWSSLQEEATEELVSLVQNHPEFTVVIGMHALGKEDLLVRRNC